MCIEDLLVDFNPNMLIQTRHGRDLFWLEEPRCRLQLGFRAFKISAPRVFNRLPREIKESENVVIFKKRLKTFLFENSYMDDLRVTDRYAV